MSIAFAATVFFLFLHAAVARLSPGQAFHVQLRLSRGVAAIILTGIGVYALARWWQDWPRAFLAHDARGSAAWQLICFVFGHFVADFLLLSWGLLWRGSAPRKDLLAHHTLGIFGCAIVFGFEVGHRLFAIALITELMPVSSGVAALAPLLRRPGLERVANQLRLVILCGMRLPLWAFLTAAVLWRIAQGEPDALIAFAQRVTLVCMAVVTCLDFYWVRLCLANLRSGRA